MTKAVDLFSPREGNYGDLCAAQDAELASFLEEARPAPAEGDVPLSSLSYFLDFDVLVAFECHVDFLSDIQGYDYEYKEEY